MSVPPVYRRFEAATTERAPSAVETAHARLNGYRHSRSLVPGLAHSRGRSTPTGADLASRHCCFAPATRAWDWSDARCSLLSNLGNVIASGAESAARAGVAEARRNLNVSVGLDEGEQRRRVDRRDSSFLDGAQVRRGAVLADCERIS
jgi:hypothetical protein